MPAPLVMATAIAIAREFFPDLARTLRRPGGSALAERVVTAAAAAAGLTPDSDPNTIIRGVRANPTAEQDLLLELEQMQTDKDIYLAEINDRDRARTAEANRGAEGRTRGNWMIAGVSAGLFSCIAAAIWGLGKGTGGGLDPGVLALITTVAGALLKMLSDVFSYEFGSSRGSKEKTDDIMAISRSTQTDTARAVQSAQTRTANLAAQVARATTSAITTGAAAAVVAEAVGAKPRDFVGMLVRGEI